MILAHPLQVVRIVSASFKFSGIPRPEAFALGAEHLIASLGFVNQNLAIGAMFGVNFEKCNRCDSVGIADMVGIIARSLEFPALGAGVFVTGGAFPSGRYEPIAVGISTAMDELISGIVGRIMLQQLSASVNEVDFEGIERLDLRVNVLDLSVNVLDEFVMSDGGLSGRKHGLFLSEENVLLMLGELASEEGLRKTEVLKLRMSELRVAEEALRNADIIAAEKGLIAGAAGGLGAGFKWAYNGFAIGGIKAVTADGTRGRAFGGGSRGTFGGGSRGR
jgi:hypothetical protein